MVKKIKINHKIDENTTIISFGDFSHRSIEVSEMQLSIIRQLKDKVAKIRMFGAACYDYSFAAVGRTDGLISITKNIWDIAPGIIICKEAGMIITNLNNDQHKFGDDGVLVSASEEIHEILIDVCRRENK